MTRRVSQDDDITYNRVSIDLMNDADIQQVFKKSYSLEDLSRLTSPTIPDIEEAEDALVSRLNRKDLRLKPIFHQNAKYLASGTFSSQVTQKIALLRHLTQEIPKCWYLWR